MHGIGENESISSGALREGDGGPFVRQDELSTQGVYVKALWLTMASRRGGLCNLLPQGLELAARQAPARVRASINSTKIARSGVEKGYLTARYGTKPGGATCSCHGEFDEEDQSRRAGILSAWWSKWGS
jgi:hypothetical protein